MAPFALLKSRGGTRDAGDGQNGVGQENAKSDATPISRQSKRKHLLRLFRTTPQKPRIRLSSEFASPVTPSFPPDDVSDTGTDTTEKPLPPPPPNIVQPESVPDPAPTKKLQRIMSTIDLPDIQTLFSGAPQFFCRSDGHYTGAPHPSVAFPWDSELKIQDLCDHHQVANEAWSTMTTCPHITREGNKEAEATKENLRKQKKAHFQPRCRERPSMLSMQGLERGTIGYQAALELGIVDSMKQREQQAVDDDPRAALELRKEFLRRKEGLRPVPETTLIDRLISGGRLYLEPSGNQRPTIDLYTELFTQLLYPPSRVTDPEDPFSLQVQIEVLVEVLATPRVWVDFSLVEWRTRLGQILWDAQIDDELAGEDAAKDGVSQEVSAQKYWLLLQILLACELLVRLDTVIQDTHNGNQVANSQDAAKFEKAATENVKWTLLLARNWLENIRVERMSPTVVQDKQVGTGWFSLLTGSVPSPQAVRQEEGIHSIRIQGRHQNRQLSGLLHFARELKWPNREIIATKVGLNTISISDSARSTPAATPSSSVTQKSGSYFENASQSQKRREFTHNTRKMPAMVQPSGWLSNSYISGLILPGEPLNHFLISTLLENDDHALLKLGEEANFYGGFVYRDRSFWSTSCIVGRVLAASKHASSCLGWISSEVRPMGIADGWVDIEVDAVDNRLDKEDKPRIYQEGAIEKESHVIGGADFNLVLPGDFVLPSDCLVPVPPIITFVSLDFNDSNGRKSPRSNRKASSTSLSVPDASHVKSYTAMMRFLVTPHGEQQKELFVSLQHDVQFVTAHPCIPSPHVEILRSPSSSFTSIHQDRSPSPRRATGHPLHKAFTYTLLPLSLLLTSPPSTPLSTLLSPLTTSLATDDLIRTHSSNHTTSSTIPKILVIDCTAQSSSPSPSETHSHLRPSATPLSGTGGKNRRERGGGKGSDVEMLVRAICAERGWNAVISRRGRGCLACAVREAGALGWDVVLRL